jgi:hypothetical protein
VRRDVVKVRDVDEILGGRTPIVRGAAIQIWRPAHKGLAKLYDLVSVPDFRYDHLVGIFVRSTLLREQQRSFALGNVICAAWNKLRAHPDRYMPLLLAEKAYIASFALSCNL